MAKFITNQNIELELELASLGDRIIAFVLDMLIISVYSLFVMTAWSMTVTGGDSYAWLAFIPVMFYSLLFETFGEGQTPGKRARDIKVVLLSGGSASFVQYLLRWLLRPIDFLFYGGIAISSIILSKNSQRLGDIVAGTTVVKQRAEVRLGDVKPVHEEDREVQFPQVRRLNDAQVSLIRKALHMRRDGFSGEGVRDLSIKIKDILSIETDMPDVKFLYAIIADYEFLATR